MASKSNSPCVSSGKTSRAVIIEIKSAILGSSKKRKNMFVKVEMNQEPQHQPLETRMVRSVAGSVLVWNQKFVFYVPHRCNSFKNNRANISFQIYMKRKLLPDALLGVAQCNLDDLLSTFTEVKRVDNDQKKKETEAEYDTDHDDDDDDDDDGDDDDHQCSYYYYSNNDSNVEDTDTEIDEAKEQQEITNDHELKSSTILEISKGEVSIGKLSIEVTMRRAYLTRIGAFKWQSFAMDYDEFLMEKRPEMENNDNNKKKPKASGLMCFRN